MERPFQTLDEELAERQWREWAKPVEWDTETIQWFNTRPAAIIDLILRFPPDAKVKAKIALDCPKPWEVGVVSSWTESGKLTVVVPGRPLRAECQPDWLEVIEYRPGMSPDDIRKYLA